LELHLALRSFEEAVYVLHAFQKKSSKGIETAQHDVKLISERLKKAQKDCEERYADTSGAAYRKSKPPVNSALVNCKFQR
jgi:hypothetical protein